MAKYVKWNPERSSDSTFLGSKQKRFLKLSSKPNTTTAVSNYYKVDDPVDGNFILVHGDKTAGKPKKKNISGDAFLKEVSLFSAGSTKRNHCLSDWVCMRTGSARMILPEGGFLWRNREGTITQIENPGLDLPYRSVIQITQGDIFFGTGQPSYSAEDARVPVHILSSSDTGNIMPKSLAGTQFGFYNSRYGGSVITVYGLYNKTTVTFGETGSNSGGMTTVLNGIQPIASPADINAGEIKTFSLSAEATRVFIESSKDVVVSVAEAEGGDRMMVAPASLYMYTRRPGTKFQWSSGESASTNIDGNVVYSGGDKVEKVTTTEIGDGSGGDSTMGLGIEYLANTFAYGDQLSDYAIIAPFPKTAVTVKYHSGGEGKEAWTTLYTHKLGTPAPGPLTPNAAYVDGTGTVAKTYGSYDDSGAAPYLGGGSNLWWFESTQPIYVCVNTPSNDEETLLGWMRKDSRRGEIVTSNEDMVTFIIDPDDDITLLS